MANTPYPPNGSRTPEAKAKREAHWRGVLERWRQSGLPKTEFSRRERISSDVLAWWQAELHKRDQVKRRRVDRPRPSGAPAQPAFVPVHLIHPPPPPSSGALEVLAGGHVVRVRPGFDAETLARLLATLEGRTC